jgi:hypothetical protein
MLERRETRAALRGAISLAIGDVRGADLDLAQGRLIAQTEREAAGALDFLRGAIEVAGIRVDARKPEQRMERALLIVHVAREVQPSSRNGNAESACPSVRSVLPRRIDTR